MEKNTFIYGTTTERAALFTAIGDAQKNLANRKADTQDAALSAANLAVLHVAEQGALTTIIAHESGGHIETRYIYREGDTAQSAKTLVLDAMFGSAPQAIKPAPQAADAQKGEKPATESANAPTMSQASTAPSPTAPPETPAKALITDPATPEVQEGRLKIQGATLSQLAVIEKFAPSKYAGAALAALQAEIEATRILLQPKAA